MAKCSKTLKRQHLACSSLTTGLHHRVVSCDTSWPARGTERHASQRETRTCQPHGTVQLALLVHHPVYRSTHCPTPIAVHTACLFLNTWHVDCHLFAPTVFNVCMHVYRDTHTPEPPLARTCRLSTNCSLKIQYPWPKPHNHQTDCSSPGKNTN